MKKTIKAQLKTYRTFKKHPFSTEGYEVLGCFPHIPLCIFPYQQQLQAQLPSKKFCTIIIFVRQTDLTNSH